MSDNGNDEMDYTSPTDLARFGRPDVVLTPKKITSAVRTVTGSQLWRGSITVGCAGVEVEIAFLDKAHWEACFEWVKACILQNQT
jgi:hypothetical protein